MDLLASYMKDVGIDSNLLIMAYYQTVPNDLVSKGSILRWNPQGGTIKVSTHA